MDSPPLSSRLTMTEWQILDSEGFSEPPSQETVSSRWRRGWVFLPGLLFVFVAGAGLFLLQEQRTQGTAALQEDLSEVIFEEESLRFLGQQPESVVTALETPSNWQRAYRRTFESRRNDSAYRTQPAGAPYEVELAQIDYFDGRCAVVRVNEPVEAYFQDLLRAYCLSSEGWRRAPIPVASWGQEQPVIQIGTGVWLRFRERDRTFAETLAGDLENFFVQINQLPVWSQVSPKIVTFEGLEIVIEPRDLQGPLIVSELERIVINSPELVGSRIRAEVSGEDSSVEPVSGLSKSNVSGEAAVRLALAEVLVRRSASLQTEPSSSLPGAARLVAAAQTVTAMHMFLSLEAESALLDEWRSRLEGRWISPFFAGLLPTPQSPPPPQAEAAALLLADYIYRLNGLDALPLMLQLLPDAASWDEVFRTLLTRSALLLEIEAAQYAEAETGSIAALAQNYSTVIPSLPLTGSLRLVDRRSFWERRLYIDLPEGIEPLLVDLPRSAGIETPTQQLLSTNCLLEQTQLSVDGEWLEVPRRLHASRVMVRAMPPLDIDLAPADTIAYLVVSGSGIEPPLSHGAKIYPNTRAYLQPRALSPAPLLVALRADGASVDGEPGVELSPETEGIMADGLLQPLLSMDVEMELMPLPIAAGQSPHFLLQFELRGCGRRWFAHYEPARGITGEWFSPPPTIQWVWRPDIQTPIFFKRNGDRQGYTIYETNKSTSFETPGLADAPFWFMGWHTGAKRLIAARFRSGEIELGLLDMAADEISNLLQPDQRALNPRGLSPDGNWLAFRAGVVNLFGPSDRVDILDLSRQSTTTLLRVDGGHGIGRPTWSPYIDQPPVLAFLTGPVDSSDILSPVRLLVVRPDQPETPLLVAQAADGELLDGPVFCQDGSLLYRVEVDDRYLLLRQSPGQAAETLLTLEQPFRLLACS